MCVTSYVMSHEGKFCTKFLIQHNFICSKFYKLYKYNINMSHSKTTGLWNNFNILSVCNMSTKPWCGPMTSKVFKAQSFVYCDVQYVMVQSWNIGVCWFYLVFVSNFLRIKTAFYIVKIHIIPYYAIDSVKNNYFYFCRPCFYCC